MIVRVMRALLTPRMLGLHLVAVVAIGAMVVLGLWQLGVYDERQNLSAAERAAQPRVAIDDVLGPDQPFSAEADGRRVTVDGTYGQPQLLVDGDDDPAPWLVAPLQTDNGSAVLVVRGRSDVVVPAVSGRVQVTGVLLPSQAREDDADRDDGVEPSLNTAQLVARMPVDVYSGYVVATDQRPAEDDATLEPVEAPTGEPSFTAGLRNLMYALQWWVFAAFAAFMWWRVAREELRQPTHR
jgi:cytochrome oxidase assembly protein ShyY1